MIFLQLILLYFFTVVCVISGERRIQNYTHTFVKRLMPWRLKNQRSQDCRTKGSTHPVVMSLREKIPWQK